MRMRQPDVLLIRRIIEKINLTPETCDYTRKSDAVDGFTLTKNLLLSRYNAYFI